MDHVFDARATVQMAEVLSVNDAGRAQTATVQTSSGAIYADVEVVQSYGMGSNVPVDGALAVLFAIGGDPANLRAILHNPSYRFGNQDPGEITIFAPDGTRVSVRMGGVIDIKGGNVINVVAPNVRITASAAVTIVAGAMTVTGPVSVTGQVSIDGNLIVTGGSITVDGVAVIVP